MVIFHSFVYVYQAGYISPSIPIISPRFLFHPLRVSPKSWQYPKRASELRMRAKQCGKSIYKWMRTEKKKHDLGTLHLPGLVNLYITNWKDPPCSSWVNQLLRLCHFQVRKPKSSLPEGIIQYIPKHNPEKSPNFTWPLKTTDLATSYQRVCSICRRIRGDFAPAVSFWLRYVG